MHEPVPVGVTVKVPSPLAVDAIRHGPVPEKVTGRPEVAVAPILKVLPYAKLVPTGLSNVIVWSALPTVSVPFTNVKV
jgi:hypothetical protein